MPYAVAAITISYSYTHSGDARHDELTLGSLLPFVGLLCKERFVSTFCGGKVNLTNILVISISMKRVRGGSWLLYK